jgi:hypothetical protein
MAVSSASSATVYSGTVVRFTDPACAQPTRLCAFSLKRIGLTQSQRRQQRRNPSSVASADSV